MDHQKARDVVLRVQVDLLARPAGMEEEQNRPDRAGRRSGRQARRERTGPRPRELLRTGGQNDRTPLGARNLIGVGALGASAGDLLPQPHGFEGFGNSDTALSCVPDRGYVGKDNEGGTCEESRCSICLLALPLPLAQAASASPRDTDNDRDREAVRACAGDVLGLRCYLGLGNVHQHADCLQRSWRPDLRDHPPDCAVRGLAGNLHASRHHQGDADRGPERLNGQRDLEHPRWNRGIREPSRSGRGHGNG